MGTNAAINIKWMVYWMFLIIILTLIVNSPLPIICDLLLFIQIMGLQVHLDIFMACKIHETFYEIEY